MKLEVGMYVRTDEGYISKILDFREHYTKGKRKIDFCDVKEVEENFLLLEGNQCPFIESIDYSIPPCYPSDEELEKIKSHIVKASHNIIDLIEVGDYVNGFPVEDYFHEYNEEKDIFENVGVITTECYLENTNFSWILEKDIKTILTKEIMEANQYAIK